MINVISNYKVKDVSGDHLKLKEKYNTVL